MNRALPDPFHDRNTDKWERIAAQEWVFRTEFESRRPDEYDEIVFESIDTLADVYLNGKFLGSASNMFVEQGFAVDGIIQEENSLLLHFKSPLHRASRFRDNRAFCTPGNPERLHVRKCQMSYGWDIAPRLLTCGVIGDVRLARRSEWMVRDVHVFVTDMSREHRQAKLRVSFDYETASGEEHIRAVVMEGRCRDNAFVHKGNCSPGANEYELILKDPHLWWTADFGCPDLYELKISVLNSSEQILASWCGSIGIRDLEHRLDPCRAYVPSSPFSGLPGLAVNSADAGDRHFYAHNRTHSADLFMEETARFVGEQGRIAMPAEETLREAGICVYPLAGNAVADHHAGTHHGMRFHPKRIEAHDSALVETFGELPDALHDYIRMSQLEQALALKLWIERQRIRKWDSSGYLVWNLTDCRPQISDAVTDYSLIPKLGYYALQLAFRPVLPVIHERSTNQYSLFVVNDTLDDIPGNLVVSDASGTHLFSEELIAKSNASTHAADFSFEKRDPLRVALNRGKSTLSNIYFPFPEIEWKRLLNVFDELLSCSTGTRDSELITLRVHAKTTSHPEG